MNLMNIEQNAENLRLLGLIVAQRGETLYQHNWDSPCRRLLFSASKSFTGAAVGFAVQEGLLRLDDRLIELFVPGRSAGKSLGEPLPRHDS